MDVREKLVEIIQNSVGGCARHWAEVIADGLLAHGVTVQEWIPVTERLPEPGDYVLVCDTREDWYGLWEFSGSAWYDASYQPWSIDEVTHWQYLPQPPKGEGL
jgi:hypothetical protein